MPVIGLTNKTAQEFWFACEGTYDPNLAALYTLLYLPALYLHDSEEEVWRNELKFLGMEPPTDRDLLGVIEFFRRRIASFWDGRQKLRLKQLAFLVEAFASLICGSVREAYENVLRSDWAMQGR